MTRIPLALAWTLAALSATAACSKSSSSTRFDVSIAVDQALTLDVVHVEAVTAGKTPLQKDFVPTANLQWTILVPNPTGPVTAAFVVTGLSGANTVVTYAASATVGVAQKVTVSLRLDAACVAITCADTAQTCIQGACATQPTFGGSVDGGVPGNGGATGAGGSPVDAAPTDVSTSAGGSGTGGQAGGAGSGTGGAGGGTGVGTGGSPADGSVPDSPMDMATIPVCAQGTHMCPGGCVANNDIRSCGTSCTPCQAPADGTATCDGTSCGGSCPADKQLCLGACIDAGAACQGTCPAQQHACGGLCPSTMDIKACGTSCLPCPVPTGATQATCDGTTCDFQCMTGDHKCGSMCAGDSDVANCGSSCVVCPTDPNGTPKCVGGACSIACATGYHSCSGKCVSNMLTTSCGASSCSECTTPTGGGATCDGTMCTPTCPSGQKLCAGACIDTAAACSGVCPSGTHDCGGLCVMNNSTDSCGTTSAACMSCPKPTGADNTTCDGTSCDFTCGSGYHRCGSRCAPDNDPTGCGTTCMNCPTDPNGAPACVLGVCGLMCNSGFHVCGGKCVDNKAVATCGPTDNTSCTACSAPSGGGTVSCDGLACQPACPDSSTKLCNGACIANSMACNGMCPANTHNCSGICQPDSSTTFCGTGCNSCSAPSSNGSAVCTSGNCGIMCNTGYRNCTGTNKCVSTNGGCCGDSECTSPPSPNMTGSCLSATCSYSCATGFTPCGGACIPKGNCCSNADCTLPKTCGATNMCSCTSQSTTTTCSGKCGTVNDNCGVPVTCSGCGSTQVCGSDNTCASCGGINQTCCAGSTCTGSGISCTSGTCQCQSGFHVCGTKCSSNTSVNSCGTTSCAACPSVPNGSPMCGAAGCSTSCNTGFMACTVSGSCIPDHWDFEDGAAHGFSDDPNDLVSLSSTTTHNGSVFSLRLQPNGGFPTSGFSLFGQSYNLNGPSNGTAGDCPSTSDQVDREGKTLSGWIYLDGTPPAGSTVTIFSWSPLRGSVQVGNSVAAVGGAWFSFSGVSTNVGAVSGFDAVINIPGTAAYVGNIYVDDLSWK